MIIMEPEDEINKLRELIFHQSELINLLGDEINDLSPLACMHGWRTTRFEQGEKIRRNIQKILKELNE